MSQCFKIKTFELESKFKIGVPWAATNLAVFEPLPLTIDQAGNFVLEAPDAELLGVLLNQLGVERFGLEADDGVGQRLPALFVEERAGFILDDRLARPAGRKGDDRPAGGHRFDGRDAEVFNLRVNECHRLAVELGQRLWAEAADELNVWFGQRAEIFFFRSLAK